MKCPLITMSAVTGKPTKDEIFEYLKSLKDNGIEQAMIYPRSGCQIEYLSEEWFLTVSYFLEYAKELDMAIWLYDDFNWPSGDAGGKVTKNPQFRLKAIKTSGENIGKLNSASSHNSGLFGEKAFPDLLSYECVDYFIKCTHEEYYKRFSEYFGVIIKGIFTDEPSIGYACKDGYIPYYDGMEKDYFDSFQSDFYADMLTQSEDFYSNAAVLISNRFRGCYLTKLSGWCTDHGILMTGHLMCDNNPLYGVQHCGDFLKNLSTFTLPGIDDIFTDFSDGCEASLFGTCEYASNENGAMAELFALGPCDMSYAKKRAMLYLCGAFKINHYFLAISHLDMRGNMLVKDYFNNFSIDQPDFHGTKLLAIEANKAAEIAKKDFTPDVYVRYPFKLCSKNLAGWIDLNPFFEMINTLTYSQIQWKFINDEITDAPVIEYLGNGEISLDGNTVNAGDLASKINHKITVTDKSLATPCGIFVRRFNGGSYVVINLFAPEQEYIIDGKSVFLKQYDVFFSDTCENKTIISEIKPSFNVSYKNENIIRTMHLNGEKEARIYLDFDTEVTLAIRKDVNAYLNGEMIITSKNSDTLPHGMRKLYGLSDKIILKKGVSIITTENDLKYMPSVFIIGDFSYNVKSDKVCSLYCTDRKKVLACGDKIVDFGAVTLECNANIPINATELELCGTELLTEVYIDGKYCGTKSFTPFTFNIDSMYRGKQVKIKIVQYSSMATIFGDVDYWDKNVINCGWRGTPSTESKTFGIDNMKFLK